MLLDTCALLWLVSGGGQLSQYAMELIDSSPIVCISAISGFEISLKYRQSKLELPVSPDEWFRIVLAHHDISVIPLSLDICITANQLPLIHKDPCGRFIIATALINDMPVITADPKFAEYGIKVVC